MKNVVFTSLDGGQSHRDLILSQLAQAHALARSTKQDVDVQIMTFAFTDPEIADTLKTLVKDCKNVTVRIIADWGQGAPNGPSVIPALAAYRGKRVSVKFKLDLPYFADKVTGRAVWGYRTSHGMLHHKTLMISCGGEATSLLSGSFNWSARGTQSYENTMLLDREGSSAVVLDAFQDEFNALWDDAAMTANAEDATELAAKAQKAVQDGASMHDLDDLRAVLAERATEPTERAKSKMETGSALPAFSGRYLTGLKAHYGFAPQNDARKLDLLRPSGVRRPAPMSINAVALETIRSVPDGSPIQVAMYAMSPRVPEYAALIDAARRGCPVQVILDGKIGKHMSDGLVAKAAEEKLPLQVRTSNRRMHQKYILSPDTKSVMTGTANMTTDSADRHAEHRILFRDDAFLTEKFSQDFTTIWKRLENAHQQSR